MTFNWDDEKNHLLKRTRNIGFEDIIVAIQEGDLVDEEERELSQSLERGEWQSIDDFEYAKTEARRYAEATLRKDRRMNVRMSERDLRNLKVRAAEEGVQYQTLVTMILHKYVSGDLIERKRAPNRSEGNVT